MAKTVLLMKIAVSMKKTPVVAKMKTEIATREVKLKEKAMLNKRVMRNRGMRLNNEAVGVRMDGRVRADI